MKNTRYLAAALTDIGNVKKINQDAAVIAEAESEGVRILLTAVCDGMGGLSRGEVASGILAERLVEWFKRDFPGVYFRSGIGGDAIRKDLTRLISTVNRELAQTAKDGDDMCGTTCTLLLMANGRYLTMNVGDSRIYEIREDAKQLTYDQTFVRREIDAGRMTEEEAKKDRRRNVLLQCIGAGEPVEPDFTEGETRPGYAYMLCSDGFRHKIKQEDIPKLLPPDKMTDEDIMREMERKAIDLVKQRREKDNITVILVKETEEKVNA